MSLLYQPLMIDEYGALAEWQFAGENILNCYIMKLSFEIRFYNKGLSKLSHFWTNVHPVITVPILEIWLLKYVTKFRSPCIDNEVYGKMVKKNFGNKDCWCCISAVYMQYIKIGIIILFYLLIFEQKFMFHL
jgi:hypothetical protein